MHLALITDGRFPLAAMGLVHIANAITVHRPVHVSERLSLRVWATTLEPHARGRQFTLRTEVRLGLIVAIYRRQLPVNVDDLNQLSG
jgi:acyl dehydratase